MKIRTQLIFTLSLFGLILIGMAVSLFLTARQVNQLRQQEEIAQRIERRANELSYLSGDYLMYGESQQRARWESSFASFSVDVSRLNPANPDQQAVVDQIKAEQGRLQAIFTDVVSTLEDSAQTSSGLPDTAFNQVSWSRMEVQNRSIAFEASLLSRQLRDQADQLKQMNSVLIFILIGIFGAYLLTNYYLIDQRTLRSIAVLQAGTAIIGSGNLDFTIAVKRADEIGELSQAFNRMAADLKEVMASKADLEREIAERKRAGEALAASEIKYRELIETANSSIIRWDNHGLIRFVNEYGLRFFGYSPEELIDRDVMTIVPKVESSTGRDLDALVKDIVVHPEQYTYVPSENITRDGRTVWVAWTNKAILDEQGNIREILAIGNDITALKAAEAALRESEEKYRNLVENAPVGLFEIDLSSRKLISVNDVMCSETGYSHAELLSMNALDLIADEHKKKFLDRIQKLMTGQEVPGIVEYQVRRKSGEVRWALLNANFTCQAGIPARARVTATDITERKQMEDALREVNEQLQAQAVEMEMQAEELQAQKNELVSANEHLRFNEELANQRFLEIQGANKELQAARLAALNLMEDALTAQEQVKQINLKLRASEQRLNRAQEIAHLGSWELDLVHDRLTWSDEAYRIFGLQPQEFDATYEAFLAAIHPDDRAAVDAAYSNSIREGRDSYEIEHRIVKHSSGEVRIVHEKCEHFRDENGQIIHSTGMVHDITERKRAEEALWRNEALLNQTGEMAKVGGWELDVQTMTLLWSRETYRIHEVDVSLQPSVETAINFYAPEAQSVINEAVSRAINEGQSYDLELPFTTATGRHLWIRTMGQPEFQDGKCVRLFGAFQDITERKQAEAALRKAHDELELRVQERTRELVREIAERKQVEKQLRIRTTAMEAAANGIIITDPQGNIQWANPALTQISGYGSRDLIGQNTRIFRSGQHSTTYYRELWNTILSGQVWRGETTNRRKDGTIYIEEQTITPVRDESNQIQHFIAIKQDISERKRAEAELAEWNIKLRALSIAEYEQRQLSESLAEAALVLNRSMKLDEVLPLILEQVKAVIPYQLAIVMMFDGESFYDAAHEGDQRWSKDLSQVKNRFPLEDFPLLTKMRQSGQPVLIPDTQKETNWMIVHGLEWSRAILCVPLLAENQVIGFLNLFSEQVGFFTQEMSNRLVAFAAHAAVAIQNAWLFEQVRASSERLQSLSRRLVEIQENERLYIARELHDEAGQILTSLMLDLVTLENQAYQPESILKKVPEMEEALNAVSENLHNVAMALRPASLDHLGLVPALRQYSESVGERYRLRVNFRSADFQERLPANMETELYRIVQEALTNVVRHAHASQVDVVLTVRDHKLIVIVEDDGNGFDPASVPDTGHLGLFGMRERAEMIGGQLVIESKPGKGTTVIVEVDYDSPIVDRG